MTATVQVAASSLVRNATLRRGTALLCVPLMAALLWSIVVWPIAASRDAQQSWRSHAVNSLARDRGILAHEAAVRARLEAVPLSAIRAMLYPQPDSRAAAAALQKDVTTLLSRAVGGGNPVVIPIPSSKQGAVNMLGVRVSASLTIDQLRKVLTDVDSSAPYLSVGSLQVTAPLVQSLEQNPQLNVALEIYGFTDSTQSDAGGEARKSAFNKP